MTAQDGSRAARKVWSAAPARLADFNRNKDYQACVAVFGILYGK